jgi:hypothetical protein
MLNEDNVQRIYCVAIVRRSPNRGAAERILISILGFMAWAVNNFLTHLDANQPPVLLFITGHFNAACLSCL